MNEHRFKLEDKVGIEVDDVRYIATVKEYNRDLFNKPAYVVDIGEKYVMVFESELETI